MKIGGAAFEAVGVFSPEAVRQMLGGRFRASFMPLVETIAGGTIRGVAAIFGPPSATSDTYAKIAGELAKADILTLATGGPAAACAKAGLMVTEAKDRGGRGLQELCEAVGCPPVLYVGSFEETARILMLFAQVVQEAGLADFGGLPIAAVCADAPRRECLPIGQCFVSSGIFTVRAGGFPFGEAPALRDYLASVIEGEVGGRWAFEADPARMAQLVQEAIEKKRGAAGQAQASVISC